MLPTDPRAKQLFHNPTALVFFDHWQKQNLEEDFQRLGELLGVYWDQDAAEALFSTRTTPPGERPRAPDKVMFPLSFIIKPEFRDIVKGMFGSKFGIDSPGWAREEPEDTVELWDAPKEEFKKFYGAFVGPRAPRVT